MTQLRAPIGSPVLPSSTVESPPPRKRSSGLFWPTIFCLMAAYVLFTRIVGPVQAEIAPSATPSITSTPHVVDWMTPATPGQLPPSHQGGENTGSVAVSSDNGGFPDHSVIANIIPAIAKQVAAIFSWYWPNLGGTNCSYFGATPAWALTEFPLANHSSGWCLSRMSSGNRWEDYVGRAIACPQSYPFGTKVYAFGREYLCLDHGGGIVSTPDGDWFDFLTPHPQMAYKSHFTVWVVYP